MIYRWNKPAKFSCLYPSISHMLHVSPWCLLNFTRSWGFGIFRVYWVSKSKCIISSNLRAEGSWGKVLNVVIFVESVVHRSNWRSRETETVGNSRKQSETVGGGPGWSCQNCQSAIFLQKKTFRAIPFFFASATGNSWKQLGLVPLTRQKTSYLKPFKVHFLYKLVLNSSFLPSQRYEPQLFPTDSRCTCKKKWDCAESFFCKKMADNGGLTILAWSRRAAPDCFRLFPTVSDCFRLFQFLCNASWTCGPLIQQKSQHSTLFLTDPSARRLLEMMHFDFETQYTLKIPKPQDLVKFNNGAGIFTYKTGSFMG